MYHHACPPGFLGEERRVAWCFSFHALTRAGASSSNISAQTHVESLTECLDHLIRYNNEPRSIALHSILSTLCFSSIAEYSIE